MDQRSPTAIADVLEAHRIWLASGGAYGERADLRNRDLVGQSFWRADLRRAMLDHSDLSAADLDHADLRGASLRWARLRQASLWEAKLTDADLRGADLRDAKLDHAELCGADLRAADLQGVSLRFAHMEAVPGMDVAAVGAVQAAGLPSRTGGGERLVKCYPKKSRRSSAAKPR